MDCADRGRFFYGVAARSHAVEVLCRLAAGSYVRGLGAWRSLHGLRGHGFFSDGGDEVEFFFASACIGSIGGAVGAFLFR